MTALENPTAARRATYSLLSSLFAALFVAYSSRRHAEREVAAIRPFDLLMLGLSTYRLGRLVAYDKVTETLRLPVAKTEPHPLGGGETTAPRGVGVRRALGELITCPICSGTWIAAALVYALGLFPGPTRALLAIMSSIGIGEFLNAATEALYWTGDAARARVGQAEEP